MKDLILSSDFSEAFPGLVQGLRKAKDIFENIHSFEDVKNVFLMGQGLSPNTYKSYLVAVKQLYEYTSGLNPVQVTPQHIESFYDYIIKKIDRNTAYLRIAGLKNFFLGIEKQIPFYQSPFKCMGKKLTRKLSRTKKGNRTKKALTQSEVNRLLTWLSKDKNIYGQGNYCMFYMLVTSGLRASELLQLKWKDIELHENKYTARFIGKGDKLAEQELYGPAVQTCLTYFKAQYSRNPLSADPVFSCVERYTGDVPGPMTYHALYYRFKAIYRNAREIGVLTRELTFTPHLCRRTYCTLLYKSGMGLKAVQAKSRHASMETLVKHYIKDEEPASSYLEKLFTSPRLEQKIA